MSENKISINDFNIRKKVVEQEKLFSKDIDIKDTGLGSFVLTINNKNYEINNSATEFNYYNNKIDVFSRSSRGDILSIDISDNGRMIVTLPNGEIKVDSIQKKDLDILHNKIVESYQKTSEIISPDQMEKVMENRGINLLINELKDKIPIEKNQDNKIDLKIEQMQPKKMIKGSKAENGEISVNTIMKLDSKNIMLQKVRIKSHFDGKIEINLKSLSPDGLDTNKIQIMVDKNSNRTTLKMPNGETKEVDLKNKKSFISDYEKMYNKPMKTTSLEKMNLETTGGFAIFEKNLETKYFNDKLESTETKPNDKPENNSTKPTDKAEDKMPNKPTDKPESTETKPTDKPESTETKPTDKPESVDIKPTDNPDNTETKPTDDPEPESKDDKEWAEARKTMSDTFGEGKEKLSKDEDENIRKSFTRIKLPDGKSFDLIVKETLKGIAYELNLTTSKNDQFTIVTDKTENLKGFKDILDDFKNIDNSKIDTLDKFKSELKNFDFKGKIDDVENCGSRFKGEKEIPDGFEKSVNDFYVEHTKDDFPDEGETKPEDNDETKTNDYSENKNDDDKTNATGGPEKKVITNKQYEQQTFTDRIEPEGEFEINSWIVKTDKNITSETCMPAYRYKDENGKTMFKYYKDDVPKEVDDLVYTSITAEVNSMKDATDLKSLLKVIVEKFVDTQGEKIKYDDIFTSKTKDAINRIGKDLKNEFANLSDRNPERLVEYFELLEQTTFAEDLYTGLNRTSKDGDSLESISKENAELKSAFEETYDVHFSSLDFKDKIGFDKVQKLKASSEANKIGYMHHCEISSQEAFKNVKHKATEVMPQTVKQFIKVNWSTVIVLPIFLVGIISFAIKRNISSLIRRKVGIKVRLYDRNNSVKTYRYIPTDAEEKQYYGTTYVTKSDFKENRKNFFEKVGKELYYKGLEKEGKDRIEKEKDTIDILNNKDENKKIKDSENKSEKKSADANSSKDNFESKKTDKTDKDKDKSEKDKDKDKSDKSSDKDKNNVDKSKTDKSDKDKDVDKKTDKKNPDDDKDKVDKKIGKKRQKVDKSAEKTSKKIDKTQAKIDKNIEKVNKKANKIFDKKYDDLKDVVKELDKDNSKDVAKDFDKTVKDKNLLSVKGLEKNPEFSTKNKEELEKIKVEIEKGITKLGSLERTRVGLVDLKVKNENKLTSLKAEIKDAYKRKSKLEASFEKNNKKSENIQNKIDVNNEKINKIYSGVKTEIKGLLNEKLETKKEINRLTVEIKKIDSLMNDIKDNIEARSKEFEDKGLRKDASSNNFEIKNEKMEARKNADLEKIKDLREKIKGIDKKIEDHSEKRERADDIVEKVNKIKDNIEKLNVEKNKQDSETADKKDKLVDATNKVNNLEKQIDSEKAFGKQLDGKIEKNNEDYKKNNDKIDSKNNSLTEKRDALDQKAKDFKDTLSERKENYEKVKNNIDGKIDALEKAKGLSSELKAGNPKEIESKIKDLKSEKKGVETKINNTEKVIDAIKTKVDNITDMINNQSIEGKNLYNNVSNFETNNPYSNVSLDDTSIRVTLQSGEILFGGFDKAGDFNVEKIYEPGEHTKNVDKMAETAGLEKDSVKVSFDKDTLSFKDKDGVLLKQVPLDPVEDILEQIADTLEDLDTTESETETNNDKVENNEDKVEQSENNEERENDILD